MARYLLVSGKASPGLAWHGEPRFGAAWYGMAWEGLGRKVGPFVLSVAE